ncbi:MAG: YitT family protein [Clostridiales bacterium]|jgi:uncharacterized membrane-anchored protein YitT (DUF2179 family)|nr:YitT family protein [Clostridiales bacterium]
MQLAVQAKILSSLKKSSVREFAGMNLGIFLVAFGVHAFRNPNKFASGGVSGLSILMTYFFANLPVGSLMVALNMLILALGAIFLGKGSIAKNIYGSFAVSGMIWLLEIIMPLKAPITHEKFMELIFSVFIPGFGSALVFHNGGTTGGTDIIAQILKKTFHMKLSMALLLIDFLIAAAAGVLFGAESCLYSVLGVCLKVFLMDSVLENLRIYKIMVIISEKSKVINKYICCELERGATVHTAHGAYTVEPKEVITTVLDRRQALLLQQFIKKEDPAAFITISNSTEIIGKGFGGFE